MKKERKNGLKEIYASSHDIIGLNGEVVRCIPYDEVAFHAGSKSMNRKSIGIETCHPDWLGKFNDKTYKTLIELLAENCKKYNIPVSNIIRHFDVTEKICPKYYVQHPSEWEKLKQDVADRLVVKEEEKKGSDEPVRTYKNGSTREDVFADVNCTNKIGSLAPYEQCDCFGIFENRAEVRYKIDNSKNWKIGFCKWTGGVK